LRGSEDFVCERKNIKISKYALLNFIRLKMHNMTKNTRREVKFYDEFVATNYL